MRKKQLTTFKFLIYPLTKHMLSKIKAKYGTIHLSISILIMFYSFYLLSPAEPRTASDLRTCGEGALGPGPAG